jgi:hypothetical protein
MITLSEGAKVRVTGEQKSHLVYAMKMAQSSRYEYQNTRNEANFKTAQFWSSEVSKLAIRR